MEEYEEYFRYLKNLVHNLNKEQYKQLEEFLGDMAENIDGNTALKEIEKYIHQQYLVGSIRR